MTAFATPPPLPDQPKKPIALPLMLAFVPAALALVIFSLNLDKHEMAAFCAPAAVISFGCCFASSFMIFSRKTTPAIITGVLFAMLNAAIIIGLGCAPILANLEFR